MLTIPAYANNELILVIPENFIVSQDSEIQNLYNELAKFSSTVELLNNAGLPVKLMETLNLTINSLRETLLQSIIPGCITELNITLTTLLALNVSMNTINSSIESESQIRETLTEELNVYKWEMRESARINKRAARRQGSDLIMPSLSSYYTAIGVLHDLIGIYYTDAAMHTNVNLMASKN